MTQYRLPFSAFLVAASTAAPAAAHHSFAMYDSAKLVDVVGVVKEFQWTNPHVILWVTKDGESGHDPELWTIELPTSTGNLSRMDWSKRSLVPGDRVTVEINPLRDGQHGGSFKKVTIAATGKVLTASPAGGPPPAAAGQATGQGAAPAPRPPVAAPTPAQPPAAAPTAPEAKPASAKQNGCACVAVGHAAGSGTVMAWLLGALALCLAHKRSVKSSSRLARLRDRLRMLTDQRFGRQHE
jgi:hypothetical protein